VARVGPFLVLARHTPSWSTCVSIHPCRSQLVHQTVALSRGLKVTYFGAEKRDGNCGDVPVFEPLVKSVKKIERRDGKLELPRAGYVAATREEASIWHQDIYAQFRSDQVEGDLQRLACRAARARAGRREPQVRLPRRSSPC